jgi:hypothetical protein
VGGKCESEVDLNELIFFEDVSMSEPEMNYTLTATYIHNFLMVWKQPFYEKELSESIDERYLLT